MNSTLYYTNMESTSKTLLPGFQIRFEIYQTRIRGEIAYPDLTAKKQPIRVKPAPYRLFKTPSQDLDLNQVLTNLPDRIWLDQDLTKIPESGSTTLLITKYRPLTIQPSNLGFGEMEN